ncbi:acyltransferase domain-containing protein [Phaeacidiphilus oryzae]|uniref:acyltransferase domain-containing protein n=1 Tax=Phaeacidiphilus oryzae TaxID=348818 RepID=UPI00068E4554|nr:acyltransferase domain-containing protein [Phaeacidiphilus oryzae]
MRLGDLLLTDEDRAEAPGAFARIRRDPALAPLVAERIARVRGWIGRVEEEPPPARQPLDGPHTAGPRHRPPAPPHPEEPAADALVFAETAEAARAHHRRRGIPARASADSLAELGRQARLYRRSSGGRFGIDTPGWLLRTWTGRIVTLGRLQAEHLSPGAVTLHIPESGPLHPHAVDESLAALGEPGGWARWFGEPPRRIECHSWLLDPALREALPAESNILRFQRRFEPADGAGPDAPADEDVVYFVFGVRPPVDLSTLPCRSRLQHAVVERLLTGGHWHARRGVLRDRP